MINGTKLLNVVGMTRGRRDGILKAEKQKQVVKIGPMHLKGVWYVHVPISLSNPVMPSMLPHRTLNRNVKANEPPLGSPTSAP